MNTLMLLTETTGALGNSSIYSFVFSIVIMIVVFYFFIIMPQKKEQKKMNQMMSELEVGDVVVTTSGFYGVLIDITDEDVIVEFGSNKNCRIPMRKSAIAQVEKMDKSI